MTSNASEKTSLTPADNSLAKYLFPSKTFQYVTDYFRLNPNEAKRYFLIFISSAVGQYLQNRVIRDFAYTANYFIKAQSIALNESCIKNSGLRIFAISFAFFFSHKVFHEYFKSYTDYKYFHDRSLNFYRKLDTLESQNGLVYYFESKGTPFPAGSILNGLKEKSEFKSELISFLGSLASHFFITGIPKSITSLLENFSKKSLTKEDLLCSSILFFPTLIPWCISFVTTSISTHLNLQKLSSSFLHRNNFDNSTELSFRTDNPLACSNARVTRYLSTLINQKESFKDRPAFYEKLSSISIKIDNKLSSAYSKIPMIGVAFRLFAGSSLSIGDFISTILFQNFSLDFLLSVPQVLFNQQTKVSAIKVVEDLINNTYKPLIVKMIEDDINIYVKKLKIEIKGKNSSSHLLLHTEEIKFLKGKVYTLNGAHGSGKSSFIKTLNGQCIFANNDENEILVQEEAANKIYSISQDGLANLPSVINVKNFLLTGHAEKVIITDAKIQDILLKLGLKKFAENLHHPFTKPSGGEQALLLIAKAIIGNAKVILIDEGMEKTSSISSTSLSERSSFQKYLKEYAQKNDVTIISIEHTASDWADYTLSFDTQNDDPKINEIAISTSYILPTEIRRTQSTAHFAHRAAQRFSSNSKSLMTLSSDSLVKL